MLVVSLRDAGTWKQNHAMHYSAMPCCAILSFLQRYSPFSLRLLVAQEWKPHLLICLHSAPCTHSHGHGMLAFVNWPGKYSHAPILALRRRNLNGKSCCSWRQQACVWLLPVLITHLKTWRLGLQSTWQSDHLLGPFACNCTPPFLGLHSFFLYPVPGKILRFIPVPITPLSQKIPTLLAPHYKLVFLPRLS